MFTKTLLRHITNLPPLLQLRQQQQHLLLLSYCQFTTGKKFKRKSYNTTNTKMQRKWLVTNNTDATQLQYNLMSYNILAQELLIEHMQIYANIPASLLLWDGRLARLATEINNQKPDILCVQEMQHEHLKQFVQHIQLDRQLEYVYKKKTNHRNDGCAIIYDGQKFKLMAELPLEYFYADNAFLNRGNVAILAKFQIRAEPEKQFIVATTHLLYNPRREEVRVTQAHLLMEALQQFSLENGAQLPIILTGDFNSQESHAASRFIGHPRDDFHMQSLDFGAGGVSTFQHEWIKVDHVYYLMPTTRATHNLCIRSVYQLPNLGQISNNLLRIPNQQLGSDHFSLALRFSIV